MLISGFFLIYAINYYMGRNINRGIAEKWLESSRQVIFNNFSRIGQED